MGTLASELLPIAWSHSASPRVYVDANVPAGLVHYMRHRLGWDALFVVEHDELRRAPDRDHFRRALDLGRTLITLDRDFTDDDRFPPALSPGVIVCSATDEPALARILDYADRELLRGKHARDMPLRGRKIQIARDLTVL